MKNTKRFLTSVIAFVLALVMTVTLPNGNVINSNAATSTSNIGLADNIQDGVMLHAWNWSYNTIKNNLADIAEAGFTTVQTSPVQQPKDYSASYTDVGGQWWKLYQPVSLSIATSSWLGTKSDLAALCSAADQYGIKIICDIVANHLGSGSGNGGLSPQVASYESDIYNNTGSTLWNSLVTEGDYSIEAVVRASYGGRPDLNTSNSTVQNRVISLLKECIDCGVDGFRWDMAKHIETPSDGYYASNFWPNVIGQATSYAQSTKGITLYNYGEILNTPGNGRSCSAYTPYMSITANESGNNVRKSVNSGSGSGASSNYYNTGVAANKNVLWAESHDTYTDGSSINTSDRNLNQTWAIVASRSDASALYFVRPGSATMGNMGTTNWKAASVAAVNKLHNAFVGGLEYLSNSGSLAMNERYFSASDNDNVGAVIVNCNGGSTSMSMTVNKLTDGSYTDLVSGNTFTVANGKVSGTINDSGVAVIMKIDNPVNTPDVTASVKGGEFVNSQTITLTLSNATSGTYKIGSDGTTTTFTGSTTFTFGSEWDVNTTKTLYLTATDGTTTVTASYDFTKVVKNDTIKVYFSNNYSWSNVSCYYWGSSESSTTWPGTAMTYVTTNQYNESIYCIELPSDVTGIIFNNGGNGCQTVDITSGIVDGQGYYISGSSSGKYTVGTYTYGA